MQKISIKHGIFINDLRFCFYHPNAKVKKFRKNSGFRKPGNLMIESLFKSWSINRNRSFMIGYQLSDLNAAKKVE